MHEANCLFCSALGCETSEDEGSALERESDVVNCSLLSLLTETSFASVVLLERDDKKVDHLYSAGYNNVHVHIVWYKATMGALRREELELLLELPLELLLPLLELFPKNSKISRYMYCSVGRCKYAVR